MAALPPLDTALVWLVFATSVVVFGVLFSITAPYGRHERRGWGPTLPARLAWVVMESPSALGFLAIYLLGTSKGDPISIAFAVLWSAHYLHRTFVYPVRMYPRGSTKRAPWMVVAMGFTFNGINSFLNARWLGEHRTYAMDWLTDPRFVVGVLVFAIGYWINRDADARLRRLRASSGGYQIPHGGLYKWISCPNYFGEVVQWSGWALATWSWPGLAFAVFTAANLVPRAISNHRWYQREFPNYPRDRKAIIPLLW